MLFLFRWFLHLITFTAGCLNTFCIASRFHFVSIITLLSEPFCFVLAFNLKCSLTLNTSGQYQGSGPNGFPLSQYSSGVALWREQKFCFFFI